jgi:dTDP-4-amino-4,6-dideoxygalactose transaminase
VALTGVGPQLARVPANRPRLPSAERLLPYLREIDENRYYTNLGPLHARLTARLAGHFGIDEGQLGLAATGTAALTGLILAIAGKADSAKPYCLCPSYTFAATALAIEACGYRTLFADIDAESLALDPQRIAGTPELDQCAVVVVVAPYGRPPDLRAWQAFSTTTGLPVIVDAAACFDTIDAVDVCRGPVAVAMSLHATKTFSTAEGGIMLASDFGLIERALAALNFGFLFERDCAMPSTNGKLSEYHAAVGLAELDGWAAKRESFRHVAAMYGEVAASAGLAERMEVNTLHANPYALFHASGADEAAAVVKELSRVAVDSRYWYGFGLHRQVHFSGGARMPLPITDDIAPKVLGLPFALDLGLADINRVLSAVASPLGRRLG